MEKSLKEKLDLFKDLSEEEREKVENKFMPSLAYVNYDELEKGLAFLKSQNVYITKAREVKVMTLENFAQKFDILREVNATDLYSQNPEALIWDALDLFKKIKYCLQSKHEYKNPDGTYKSFLFNAKEWGEEFSLSNIGEEEKIEEQPVRVEVNPVNVTLENPDDIKKYNEVMAEASRDFEDIGSRIERYDAIKENLEKERQLDEGYNRASMQSELGLDALDSMTDNYSESLNYNSSMYGMENNSYTPLDNNGEMYSFNDIPLEQFEVNGRGR